MVAAMISSSVVVGVISTGNGELAGDDNRKSRKSAMIT
jgi:hypothetical protein